MTCLTTVKQTDDLSFERNAIQHQHLSKVGAKEVPVVAKNSKTKALSRHFDSAVQLVEEAMNEETQII